MPLIDNPQRITPDGFEDDDKAVIEGIGVYYNTFVEQVTNVLNGKIDYDNLNRKLTTLELTVSSSGLPLQTTRFSSDVGLVGISVIKVTNLTNLVIYPTGNPLISFTASGTGVYTVNHVTGLPSGSEFRLVMELIY
jgi:hypothetical protein